MKPAIVVIAYNRPHSIMRLLNSLSNANYLKDNISLIISIDYQDSKNHSEVIIIAEQYNWIHGKKNVIIHPSKLGLRKHVISCGDLVEEFDSIIMLEDDLFVSPYFYIYASNALMYYQNCNQIGGISLYNHKRNFLNDLPFELIPDSNDVFFLQIASSWGQAWTKKQWFDFKDWYVDSSIIKSDDLPNEIIAWPETSWLKYFIKYLISTNKYFVYPNKSLSTNFGDSGTHNKEKNVEYQVFLFFGDEFNFIDIENSINVYDVFFEILPSRLKLLVPRLKEIDFSVDLYGKKEINKISTKYLISSKKMKSVSSSSIDESFGLELKPMILNIVFKVEGNMFNINLKEVFENNSSFENSNFTIFNYFYSKVALKNIVILFVNRLKYKLKILFSQ